jgi:hypothetical protein
MEIIFDHFLHIAFNDRGFRVLVALIKYIVGFVLNFQHDSFSDD